MIFCKHSYKIEPHNIPKILLKYVLRHPSNVNNKNNHSFENIYYITSSYEKYETIFCRIFLINMVFLLSNKQYQQKYTIFFTQNILPKDSKNIKIFPPLNDQQFTGNDRNYLPQHNFCVYKTFSSSFIKYLNILI